MIAHALTRRLARGLYVLLIILFGVGSALLPRRTSYATTYALVRTFLNPAPDPADTFGQAVAWVGQRALIGAPADAPGGVPEGGAAYLYDSPLDEGVPPIVLTATTPITAAQFGSSLAATAGSLALVGAPGDKVGAINAGVVYLFDVAGQVTLTMTNPSPASNERFGAAVAGLGDDVLVGAPGANSYTGKAYLMNGATGALSQTISNPAPAFLDTFGNAVATNGADKFIGAPLDQVGSTSFAGAAYLVNMMGTVTVTISKPVPASGDNFGWSVASYGNLVLVGAPEDSTLGPDNAGAAYLFDGATGALLYTFYMTPTAPYTDTKFGFAVAMDGQHILIGAPGVDASQTLTDTGAAYLFDATTYDLIQVFDNPTPAAFDAFGTSVAVNTDLFLVGAPGGGPDPGPGVAYLFGVLPPTPTPLRVYLPMIEYEAIP